MTPGFPRREFLKRSTMAAAAFAFADASGLREAVAGEADGAFLSTRERRVLAALARRMLPSGGAFEAGADEIGVADKLDAFLVTADPAIAGNFRAGLWLLELGAPALEPGLSFFTSMAPERQDRFLASLPKSRFSTPRELFSGYKRACFFAFYDDPRSWPAIGYDGPWLGRALPGEAAP